MPRYFLEVAYKGTNYSGFQVQQNANTIQAELEKAFRILLRQDILLTGSSRTDAGVHAIQNFFHFDADLDSDRRFLYKLNSILPKDIVAKKTREVNPDSHCRFDAINREYKYYIYKEKNPFLCDRAFYYPYTLDFEAMKSAALILPDYLDYSSFSKRKTQVKTFNCKIKTSKWMIEDDQIVFHVVADRFLRGMVRGLVATMLLIGRKKITIEQLREIIQSKDCTNANFASPPQGLFLISVEYPVGYFNKKS